MGMTLELFTTDEEHGGHILPRRFMDEIIFKNYDFLSKEEQNILIPNSFGQIALKSKRKKNAQDYTRFLEKHEEYRQEKISEEAFLEYANEFNYISEKVEDRERNPKLLKSTLKKVQQYWRDNAENLPVEHYIYPTPLRKSHGYITSVRIDGIEIHIDGNLGNKGGLQDKIQLKSFGNDYGKIDFYLTVEPEIILGGKRYYTTTLSKVEVFEEVFDDIFEFLDKVIELNINVLWEFG